MVAFAWEIVGEMENWDAIAESKKIPRAFFDERRSREKKFTRRMMLVMLLSVIVIESFLLATRMASVKDVFLQVAPLTVGLVLSYYLLRHKRWYVTAACIFLASCIVEYFVTPQSARGSDAFLIAYGMLSVLAAIQLQSVRRYEDEIRKRLGGTPSSIKPA